MTREEIWTGSAWDLRVNVRDVVPGLPDPSLWPPKNITGATARAFAVSHGGAAVELPVLAVGDTFLVVRVPPGSFSRGPGEVQVELTIGGDTDYGSLPVIVRQSAQAA